MHVSLLVQVNPENNCDLHSLEDVELGICRGSSCREKPLNVCAWLK